MVIIFSVFTILWYTYTTQSSSFSTIITNFNNIINTFTTEFLNTNSVRGLALLAGQRPSIIQNIIKYVIIFSQICISISLFASILKIFTKEKHKFSMDYLQFSIVYFLILVMSITVPNFASSLQTSRLYQIALIFLAPFFVIGCISVYRIIKIVDKNLLIKSSYCLLFLSTFLCLYLLLNAGVSWRFFMISPYHFH